MDITYNGMYEPSEDILTFTEVPNILKVEEVVLGTNAQVKFFLNDDLRASVTADSQYYITFLGETITNVMDASQASNKRFFIASTAEGTAMSMARALRNCGGIAADFNILNVGKEVHITAKTIGSKWANNPNYLQRNIGGAYMGVAATDGEAYSDLYNSKIDVDVYKGGEYVTSLEKNFYGNECGFDVSPVLSTFSEYGRTVPYGFNIQLIKENGEVEDLGSVSGNTTIGYLANQSDQFMYLGGVQMLINKNRPITLYTYDNVIDYSVVCDSNTFGWDVYVSVKDSGLHEIYSGSSIGTRQDSNISDKTVSVPQSAFTDAYYVDITIGGDTTRFNVIKPLKATEYYQRVEWRNEYGGISFFDFTGARSESDSVDIETYEKNVYDFYSMPYYEKKKIYKNDYDKSVTLTSHLMEENGKYIFNSLMRSKKVWTRINGRMHYIIPTSIDVQEDQNYNNIYTAKLTYKYSALS